MQTTPIRDRLAVCSWSLQPATPEELAHHLTNLEIPRVQLALDPLCAHPEIWGKTPEVLTRNGITIVSGMFGTLGEDYSTLESIQRTGGLVPDEHWPANWDHIQQVARLAADLPLPIVTFHAGFLPHEPEDPGTLRLLNRIGQVADLFARHSINLGFETGQESAPTLRAFLIQLNRANAGVNFDPANMLLYDKGNPVEALRELGPWLKQCHIKDAVRTQTPGTWGEEVPVGKGEVNWPAFLQTLQELGYRGPLCIEREAGNQRSTDILAARRHLENLAAQT